MLAGLALLAGALLLAGLTAATAARPALPLPDRAGYLRRWSALHGGYDPGRVVGGWLALVEAAARPLARRGALPDVLTLWTVEVSAAVVALAASGGRWPVLAAAVTVASGLLDNLDGAVAVLSGRASRIGFVLDSVVDRVCDCLYLVALWRLGAHPGLCVGAGIAMGLLEYTRARAGNAGMGQIGVVTVGERPTRIIVTALFLLGGGLWPASAGGWASAGAAGTCGVCLAGLGQLGITVRRILGGG